MEGRQQSVTQQGTQRTNGPGPSGGVGWMLAPWRPQSPTGGGSPPLLVSLSFRCWHWALGNCCPCHLWMWRKQAHLVKPSAVRWPSSCCIGGRPGSAWASQECYVFKWPSPCQSFSWSTEGCDAACCWFSWWSFWGVRDISVTQPGEGAGGGLVVTLLG